MSLADLIPYAYRVKWIRLTCARRLSTATDRTCGATFPQSAFGAGNLLRGVVPKTQFQSENYGAVAFASDMGEVEALKLCCLELHFGGIGVAERYGAALAAVEAYPGEGTAVSVPLCLDVRDRPARLICHKGLWFVANRLPGGCFPGFALVVDL